MYLHQSQYNILNKMFKGKISGYIPDTVCKMSELCRGFENSAESQQKGMCVLGAAGAKRNDNLQSSCLLTTILIIW